MSKESEGMWQGTVKMYFNRKLPCLLAFNNVLGIAVGTDRRMGLENYSQS
jgi:hypothetical protein